jgi:hypothetical protein
MNIMNYSQAHKIQYLPRLTIAVIFFLAIASHSAIAATVLYVGKTSAPSDSLQQIKEAARFYGLDMSVTGVAESRQAVIAESIQRKDVVAAVITADALSHLDRKSFLKENTRRIPLLIIGIENTTSPDLLKEWSSGLIVECRMSSLEAGSKFYVTTNVKDVTRQLSGVNLPLKQSVLSYLAIKSGNDGLSLMNVSHGNTSLPVFARARSGDQDIFFATKLDPVDVPVAADPYRQQAVFASSAVPMIFLHHAAGEYGWHSPGNYANLTIDDIWLREPYGHVNYKELLNEAKQHNFHMTAAFIPWNFDRSRPDVVSLFLAHPDKLSICMHGNNHVHQEFGPLDSHPLSKQIVDIKQGLARMEKFSQLTHIPYDAVMVFPHSIAPMATLAELKRYNLLATANSLNVPLDTQAQAGAEFALRTGTLQFANFPSLRRYSAETSIPEPQLAIDAFLGNPMLFYGHESFFSSGMGAFNEVADTVNKLQPDTQWKGLGYIVRHLYLEKLRDDGNYDVRAYSASIELKNPHSHDAVFFVEKAEDFAMPLEVFVDGKSYPYQRSGSHLRLELPIQAGMTREIGITYGNDFNLAAVDISKNSLKTNAIRSLSDFRDDFVSRSALGRRFIHSYAENGSEWNRVMLAIFAAAVLLLVFNHMRKAGKKVRTLPKSSVMGGSH